ncbi:MAG: excinuclease ABC subunit A [Crocinitomicaceae bacterium]|nr:excinuclease ABC subunit A [Crocinitomicaceae bacterium]|tara:strand:+ start:8647 stop:11466 length:2820 start_codon:yes stop_codon:yes gene_type:complete
MADETDSIVINGAREHNLRDIDVVLPRNKLIVFTGVSGSGKSSLAFDTIYAEGSRRYLETLSSYARQFIGGLKRPNVEYISGLSPVISIEQKTVTRNPRSTVGTVTEVHDFLRLLFARAATAYSIETGEPMVKNSDEDITASIEKRFADTKLLILAPIVRGRKGHYRELFENVRKQGYVRARVDGEIVELDDGFKVDRYKVHDIELVVDRIIVGGDNTRLNRSVRTALKLGKGSMCVIQHGVINPKLIYFSRNLMCPTTGIAYPDPEPNLFSFNSPYGACPTCNGLGNVAKVDRELVFPDPKKSVRKGGIAPLGELTSNKISKIIEAIITSKGMKATTPIGELSEEIIGIILYGSNENITLPSKFGLSETVTYDGLVSIVETAASKAKSIPLKRWAQQFMQKVECSSCKGTRLKPTSLHFKIADKNIADLGQSDFIKLSEFFDGIEAHLDEKQNKIAREPLKEIRARIGFMIDVGLGYLSLDRLARSLSGGEGQRIRLATQIGSKLTEVLYILDEPSIGLHQRDNQRLISSLKTLRDAGNSIIVVEHDEDMMRSSDFLVDIGPGAGKHGGTIVTAGPLGDHLTSNSITAAYLNGDRKIETPQKRRKGNKKKLTIKGASGHNLKNVDLSIPLGTFTCVAGVSGSGKSSLINQTLYPALQNHLHEPIRNPLPHKKILGMDNLDKVIAIDQTPIGRTPRSNPATYTGMMDHIRKLFTLLPEAKIRGYKPGRFSFNVVGGRCEDCKGAGLRTVEMNYLPDVYVPCVSCDGKRFNRETLEVRYKGKSISDVLAMTINEANEFFDAHPKLKKIISTLKDVGLGYITLGQPSTTLSGGEAQRVKLASELSRANTGNTLYILDEPTTGLHFQDVEMLLNVLNRLVNLGNTVIVIEHHLDVIKVADHVIDMGPEGGIGGGKIVAQGTPESVANEKESATGKFLAQMLA